jgi:hypothetical protein
MACPVGDGFRGDPPCGDHILGAAITVARELSRARRAGGWYAWLVTYFADLTPYTYGTWVTTPGRPFGRA